MIIVVPSCLKDADGARTRSDQNYTYSTYIQRDGDWNIIPSTRTRSVCNTSNIGSPLTSFIVTHRGHSSIWTNIVPTTAALAIGKMEFILLRTCWFSVCMVFNWPMIRGEQMASTYLLTMFRSQHYKKDERTDKLIIVCLLVWVHYLFFIQF